MEAELAVCDLDAGAGKPGDEFRSEDEGEVDGEAEGGDGDDPPEPEENYPGVAEHDAGGEQGEESGEGAAAEKGAADLAVGEGVMERPAALGFFDLQVAGARARQWLGGGTPGGALLEAAVDLLRAGAAFGPEAGDQEGEIEGEAEGAEVAASGELVAVTEEGEAFAGAESGRDNPGAKAAGGGFELEVADDGGGDVLLSLPGAEGREDGDTGGVVAHGGGGAPVEQCEPGDEAAGDGAKDEHLANIGECPANGEAGGAEGRGDDDQAEQADGGPGRAQEVVACGGAPLGEELPLRGAAAQKQHGEAEPEDSGEPEGLAGEGHGLPELRLLGGEEVAPGNLRGPSEAEAVGGSLEVGELLRLAGARLAAGVVDPDVVEGGAHLVGKAFSFQQAGEDEGFGLAVSVEHDDGLGGCGDVPGNTVEAPIGSGDE